MSVAMKDSRVSWIGDIPAHWEMRKVSRSFRVIGSGTTPSAKEDAFHEEGTIPWVNTGDLNDGVVVSTEKRLTQRAVREHSTLHMYVPGTLLIAMYGATIGKVGVLGIEACTNQACCALGQPEHFDTRFIYYWFLDNRRNLVALSYGGGQPNINQDLIRAFRVQSPSLADQRRIAAYLDAATGKIDRLMSLRRRQVELLREQRAALIQQAVTRSLNPRAPLQDSGLPWLGQIPKHWQVLRIAIAVTKNTNGFVGPTRDILVEDGVRYLQSLHIKEGEIRFNTPYFVSEQWSQAHKKSILKEGDVLVVQTGDVGQVAAVPKEFENCNCHALIILRMHPELGNGFYLATLFNAHFGKQFLMRETTGALHPHLECGKIRDIRLPFPPLNEQQEILAYIQRETVKLDGLHRSYERQLGLLAEYRASLIHESVTGQRPVTN
ncbi:MAG: restriction endonuclease subunit S [Verrucomicrobia bacterium]|nr:restriction endonuclease subunit S [Verrucomicrobiota bacterium]